MTATRFATGSGVALAYEVHGDTGPDVVLVHGLGYARWGWEPVVGPLAERMRVIVFDNRGVGESGLPPGPYSAAGMATDVLAVLDAVGVGRAHVVGASLGGMVAQELAIDHPQRVDRLVLAGTTPGAPEGLPMPAATVELLRRVSSLEPAEALRRLVANALSPRTVAERPDVVERIVRHRLANPQPQAGWEAQAAAGLGYEGHRRQHRIAAPTLVVHGAADAVVDPGNAALLTSMIPDARQSVLLEAGHLLFWEQPERFVQLVTDFLLAG